MLPPGLRLRQAREALGLTYRDVEKASYQIAVNRGRPDFVLHISRLADIENRGVVPSLHKLYSLATILHLDPMEISGWYEAPFRQTFHDSAAFPPVRTSLSSFPVPPPPSEHSENASAGNDTALMSRQDSAVIPMPRLDPQSSAKHRYGYVGLSDRRMMPLLRPGSTVLIDTTVHEIEDSDWSNEYDRPMYFVELRNGYRCGWFQKNKSTLIMQPHTLSRCAPEAWRTPDEAEIVGKVIGIVSYLGEPWTYRPVTVPEGLSCWSRKAL